MEKPTHNGVAAPVAPPLQPKKTQAHLPSIDGLRGLAAMMVVFVHCWCINGSASFPQFTLFGVTVPVYRIFIPGVSGVYLFFVLSGFCLSYPFLSNPQRKDNWPRYALNRVRRILPAYMISFAILFLIGHWLRSSHISSGKFLFESFKSWKFVRELFLIQQSKVANSYWTLVLEWRWYFVFPGLLLLVRRVSPALLVAALYGLAYCAQKPPLFGALSAATFLNLAIFLPMFAFGIWAAQLVTRPPENLARWERELLDRSLWGFCAGILWCLMICPHILSATSIQLAVAWGPLYFFLVLAALKNPWFNRLFGSAPFVKLGMVSYSIYLLQEPVIRAGNLFLDKPEHGPMRLLAHHYLLMPLLCVLAGWGLYHLGERPFLKRRVK